MNHTIPTVIIESAVGDASWSESFARDQGRLMALSFDNFLLGMSSACLSSFVNTSKTEWSNIGVCRINDTQLQNRSWQQYDENNCGTYSNETFCETQEIPCEYCTISLMNTTWSDWTNVSCLSTSKMSEQRTLTQYDSNNCGSYSNQTLYDYREVMECEYIAPIVTNSTFTCIIPEFPSISLDISDVASYWWVLVLLLIIIFLIVGRNGGRKK
jgi:hypothetical protein